MMLLVSLLILPLLSVFSMHSDKTKELREAQKIMDELLSGQAESWRYVAGTFTVVVFVCFVVGLLVWICYIIGNCCWCTRKSCCGVWWLLKKLFSCCGCGREKEKEVECLGGYRPFDEEFEVERENCTRETVTIMNARRNFVQIPYCKRHVGDLEKRVFFKANSFEASGTKYVLDVYYIDVPAKLKYSDILSEAIASAGTGTRTAPGFIYIFRSSMDLERVAYRNDDTPYFFKIGMTRRKTAKERVSEWEDSNFGNEENKDWWAVPAATKAELLVHAVLAKSRIARYNNETHEFEVEWFFVKKTEAIESIQLVVDALRKKDFGELQKKV